MAAGSNAVDSLVMSFVAPQTDAEHSDGNPGRVFIIVPRQRGYLADMLVKAFAAREDVEIVVDRRYGERRIRNQPTAVERRLGPRRRSKEEVIEVVVRRTGHSE